MDLASALQEVRTILSEDASEAAWNRLKVLLNSLASLPSADLDMAIEYTKEHLGPWIPALDVTPMTPSSSVGWAHMHDLWPDFPHGTPPPSWRIAHSYDLGYQELQDDTLLALLEEGNLQGVRRLNLEHNHLTAKSTAPLLQHDALSQCEQLDFESIKLEPEWFGSLAHSTQLTHLRSLILNRTLPDKDSLGLLGHVSSLPNVQSLNLYYNNIDDEGIQALIEGPLVQQLTRIGLHENAMSGQGLSALLGRLEQVIWLAMGKNEVDQTTIDALANSHLPSQLMALHIGGCPSLNFEAVQALAQVPFTQLKKLWAWSSPMGDHGLEELTRSPHLHTIEELYLSNCSLTRSGLSKLLQSNIMDDLRVLNIYYNHYGNEGIQELAECEKLQTVNRLDLYRTGMTFRGFEALARSPYMQNLETLAIGNNYIEKEGLSLLFSTPNFPKVAHLAIRFINSFTKQQSKELVDSSLARQLKTLDMRGMKLANGSMQVMARSDAFEALEEIDLTGNDFSEKTIRALCKASWFPQLHTLYLPRMENSQTENHLKQACREVGVKYKNEN